MKKEYEFIIKENNDAYKIFQKFYDKVIKEVKEKPINYLYHSDLIQNNKLHFESDAPNDLFTYNYLDIEKRDSEISLKVIDNTNECFTNFEINTDRSKYYTLRFFFIDLLNELKTIKTNEYVYTKRR